MARKRAAPAVKGASMAAIKTYPCEGCGERRRARRNFTRWYEEWGCWLCSHCAREARP